MIKINLLPYRVERKKQLIIQQSLIALCALLPAILIIGVLWYLMGSKIAEADNEIVRLKSEIKKQEKTIKKIKDFKKKKETLTKKMGVINTLRKGKSGPVHLIDELAINLPGGLWLTSIIQKGMNIDIKGKSLGNFAISERKRFICLIFFPFKYHSIFNC